MSLNDDLELRKFLKEIEKFKEELGCRGMTRKVLGLVGWLLDTSGDTLREKLVKPCHCPSPPHADQRVLRS
jgi:hypothetical protein